MDIQTNLTQQVDALNTPDALKKCIDFKVANYCEHIVMDMPSNLYQICIQEVEKTLFLAVLKQTQQNQSQAAKLLGINRGTLKKKIQQYNI